MSFVYVGLLGPLEVSINRVVHLGPQQPKQQATLAMITNQPGQTISATKLIDGIWGSGAPQSARSSLRNYVSSLRATLRQHGCFDADVRWVGGGYRFDGELSTDAMAADELAVQARRDRMNGRLGDAADKIAEALRLWRGEPLSGVPGPWAEGERARLYRTRDMLRQWRIEIQIESGDYTDAISRLAALVRTEPQCEKWWLLLTTALAQSGRRLDALGAYRDARRWFVKNTGLEPSPELSDLHRRLLNDDQPTSEHRPDTVAPATPALPVPAQLPAGTVDFIGRTTAVEQLVAAATPGTIISVTGLAGVGKSALAVHVAHRLRERFPDGQLYADLRGPVDVTAILRRFLSAFGIQDSEIPDNVFEQSTMFRSVVAGRRVLIVLDNADAPGQLEWLLPGAAASSVLVTSRGPITATPTALRLPLGSLTQEESAALLSRTIGDARPTAESAAFSRLVSLCGGLPLAIGIIATRLAARPSWPISGVVERLLDGRDPLREYRFQDMTLEAAFRSDYQRLGAEQARAFRLLAHAEVPDLTSFVASIVLDREIGAAEALCDDLVDRSLLDSPDPGRYRYHPLVRSFARGCSDAEPGIDVVTSLLAGYSALIQPRRRDARADRWVLPAESTRTPPIVAGGEVFPAAEYRNLVAVYGFALRGTARQRQLAAEAAPVIAELIGTAQLAVLDQRARYGGEWTRYPDSTPDVGNEIDSCAS
ncbi:MULTISPECIES: BTAD domain-containing putative transcriptional regulator [unclassified Nocardia]|uniref:AfsR/SARP family transcriptional regulator n=1 Tax=unclassified Nocardia TaxID=2637762 RepID=UPI001CE41157|nr:MULTISPECIES: BTAD domain-containing putative transcriptional regulator [unclassified Nocardia]